MRELERRLTAEAGLAAALLQQASGAGAPLVEYSSDPYVGLLRVDVSENLDRIQDYVVVVDSAGRSLYGSAAVRRLTPAASDLLRERAYAVTGSGTSPTETFSLI